MVLRSFKIATVLLLVVYAMSQDDAYTTDDDQSQNITSDEVEND
jgi:hypothetical protein